MNLKVFTLVFDAEAQVFDDSELHGFQAEHEVVGLYQHFFLHQGTPHWVVMVDYKHRRPGAHTGEAARPDLRREHKPRIELPPEHRGLYDAMREWRRARSERDGRPDYLYFTNRALAEIARRRPATLEALREIPGIGEAKSRDFGAEVLALVSRVAVGATSAESTIEAPAAADP